MKFKLNFYEILPILLTIFYIASFSIRDFVPVDYILIPLFIAMDILAIKLYRLVRYMKK